MDINLNVNLSIVLPQRLLGSALEAIHDYVWEGDYEQEDE